MLNKQVWSIKSKRYQNKLFNKYRYENNLQLCATLNRILRSCRSGIALSWSRLKKGNVLVEMANVDPFDAISRISFGSKPTMPRPIISTSCKKVGHPCKVSVPERLGFSSQHCWTSLSPSFSPFSPLPCSQSNSHLLQWTSCSVHHGINKLCVCELVSYSKVLQVQVSPILQSQVAWLPTTRPTLQSVRTKSQKLKN